MVESQLSGRPRWPASVPTASQRRTLCPAALHCTEITHPPSTCPSVPLTPSKPKRARHEHGSCHCHCHCHAGPDQPANGPLQQGASGRPAGRTTPHPPTRGATATGTHEPARQALCAVARGRSRSRPRRAGVHQFPTVLRMRRAGGGGVKRKAASIKHPWRPPARPPHQSLLPPRASPRPVFLAPLAHPSRAESAARIE